MAPKVELRRITTIAAFVCLDDRGCDEALAEIHAHRARLDEVDELDELVRRLEDGERAVRLSSPRDLLHDTLYGALIDSGERLAETSTRCRRGELPLERVQQGAEEVLALDALLRSLDR